MTHERVLYISGPLRAANGAHGPFTPYVVEQNTRLAERYAILGWRAGWAVICPHLNTRSMDGVDGMAPAAFISGDLTFLERMICGLDAVLFLPGWKESEGSNREHERAAQRGLYLAHAETLGSDEFVLAFLRALYCGYANGKAFLENHRT